MVTSPHTPVPTLSGASNLCRGEVNSSHEFPPQVPHSGQVVFQQNSIDQEALVQQQLSVQVGITPSTLQGSQPNLHHVMYDYQQQITKPCYTTGTSVTANSSYVVQPPMGGSPFNAPLNSFAGYQQQGEISKVRNQSVLYNNHQIEPNPATQHIPQSYTQRSAQLSTNGYQSPVYSTRYVQQQVPQMIMATPEVHSRQHTQYHMNLPQPHLFSPEHTIQGTGIDVRSTFDAKVTADQQSLSVGGSPGSAHGRVALLHSALTCKLVEFLVHEVLESPSLTNVKDPASAKVHTVELLTMLTKDPGFGMKFQLILNDIPAWKKYKFQDHSLFITGIEQRSDYFLTEGDGGQQPCRTGLISENKTLCD